LELSRHPAVGQQVLFECRAEERIGKTGSAGPLPGDGGAPAKIVGGGSVVGVEGDAGGEVEHEPQLANGYRIIEERDDGLDAVDRLLRRFTAHQHGELSAG